MKITKYEHACFVVEKNGASLVVDPGGFTTDFVVPDAVTAVVVTHEHADHFNADHLRAIVDKYPDALIIAPEPVTAQLDGFNVRIAVPNEGMKVGEFELEFYGGNHAVITPQWPVITNIGLMIDGRLYYPGDSFFAPDRPVEILALPVAAPWLKISEVMDFLQQVRPTLAFPTHDAILSDAGKGLPDTMLPGIAEQVGTTYRRLLQPLEV